jgi:hypothetical protein
MYNFNVQDWYWIIGGDTSRAWSSASRSYVNQWDNAKATRIASEQELGVVLRGYGLVGPLIEADDVRAEAQRRIIAAVGATNLTGCFIKQLNANMRANELNDIRHTRSWTTEESAEADALRALAEQIKAIRAASNAMEANPPSDYTNNSRWP